MLDTYSLLQEGTLYLHKLKTFNRLPDELRLLVETSQNPKHHPEGSVWFHTLYVIDAAFLIADRENLDAYQRYVLVMAALLHDIGKPATTVIHEDGRITTYDHDRVGANIARDFLIRLGVNYLSISHIVPLIEQHMCLTGFQKDTVIKKKHAIRINNRLQEASFYLLLLLIEADHSGRPPLPVGLPDRAKELGQKANEAGLLPFYHTIDLNRSIA